MAVLGVNTADVHVAIYQVEFWVPIFDPQPRRLSTTGLP